jgi:hypothetical protein
MQRLSITKHRPLAISPPAGEGCLVLNGPLPQPDPESYVAYQSGPIRHGDKLPSI